MPKNKDVIIIGGGPVGAACASELAAAGRSVLVLESGNRTGTAWEASAGMLAPQVESSTDNPLFEIGIAGREYYRDKAAQFADDGVDIELYDGGILRLAATEEEERAFREAVAWQRQHGHRADWLDLAELENGFPWVGKSLGALWAPHDGSLNPVKLVAAFRKAATASGAEFVTDTAVALEVSGGRATGVRGERGKYSGADVLLAAGAWSGRIEGLPRPLSVEPVRGQMISKPWPGEIPPAIVFGSHGYVLERGGQALCGATMEHAGFAVDLTEAGAAEVAASTDKLIPALEKRKRNRHWAGLRPGTPDGLPIVGSEPLLPNLWYATGHGRNGILLAGITAVALGHLMANEATFEGVEAMRPDRFWSW